MKTYKIACLPGDGIGPEVIREGRKVLESVSSGFKIDWVDMPYSGAHYLKTGELVPKEALDAMARCAAIYLGAIGHPDIKPGIVEKEILLKIRFHFDQYVNLRPVKLYEGVKSPLAEPGNIDFTVIRENTEDFYVGIGGKFKEGTKDESAFQIGVMTYKGCERIARYAFEFAKKHKKTKVTLVDKANVLSHIYSLWRRVFEEVAAGYPNIERDYAYVDAMTQWLVRKPSDYQVVLAPNMFGDIITDLAAAIQGGMGVAAGANINPEGLSMFEPIHGSAPKHAGKNIINPIAAILSGKLMLETLGEQKAADKIEKAVAKLLKDGKVRTYDLGGTSKTSEVGDAVAAMIERM